MNSFQVKIDNSTFLKKTLLDLWEKHIGRKNDNTVGPLNPCPASYYIFYYGEENTYHAKDMLYHTDAEYGYRELNTVSLDETIKRLSGPKPSVIKTKTVILNEQYNVTVFSNDNQFVKVGCQKIPITAIRELVKVIDEFGF